MTRRRLITRLVASRQAQAAGLVLSAAALALLSCFLMIGQDNAREAQAESVRGFAGGGEQLFQPQNEVAEAAIAATGLAQPIWFLDGQIATSLAETSAEVRMALDPMALATLESGKRPAGAAEVAVSLSVRDALGVGVGDSVTISESGVTRSARIVGVVVDTGDADSAFVLALGSPVESVLATWVTTSSYDEVAGSSAAVADALASRTLKPRTVELLAEDSVTATLGWISESQTVLWPVALVVTALIGATTLAAMRASTRKLVEALLSAGMPSMEAIKTVLGAATLLLYAGTLVGAAAAAALSLLLKGFQQNALGQHWSGVAIPYVSVLGYIALAPVSAAVLVILFSRFRLVRSKVVASNAVGWIGLAATVSAGLLWLAIYMQWLGVDLVRVACVVTVIGVAMLLSRTYHDARGAGSPLRRVGALLASRLIVPSLIVALGLGLLSLNAAHQIDGSRDLERQQIAIQPPGSMVVFEVSADGSQYIAEAYETAGGTNVSRIAVPLEQGSSLRVTSPEVGACMEEAKTSVPETVLGTCSPDTLVPVNAVGLSYAEDAIVADPALVSGGEVGLLLFDAAGAATVQSNLAADADPSLGGNLPGLVVPIDSRFAQELDLRPSGSEYLVLPGFSSLPERQQAELRATISRVAGAAQISEDRGFNDDGRLLIGIAIIAVAAIGAAALWATSLGAFVASLRRFRQDVGLLGVRDSKRYRLFFNVFAPALCLQLVSAACVAFGAWLESGRSSYANFAWLLPYVTAVAITIAVVWIAARIPRRSYVD